jgi:hypothetical protein
VKLLEPPSFTPVNANQSVFQIEGDQVLDSLVTQLTGAAVKVVTNDNKDFSGTLMGKQVTEEDSGTYKITVQKLLVLTDDGMRVLDLADVKTVDFTEADIKAEIAKALLQKRQQIGAALQRWANETESNIVQQIANHIKAGNLYAAIVMPKVVQVVENPPVVPAVVDAGLFNGEEAKPATKVKAGAK